ncbi:hypothetical protein KEM55_005498 [Ascosphaera atra]|nr:hypothetical protein KEM55_005498 [Ascosphaera atra]
MDENRGDKRNEKATKKHDENKCSDSTIRLTLMQDIRDELRNIATVNSKIICAINRLTGFDENNMDNSEKATEAQPEAQPEGAEEPVSSGNPDKPAQTPEKTNKCNLDEDEAASEQTQKGLCRSPSPPHIGQPVLGADALKDTAETHEIAPSSFET